MITGAPRRRSSVGARTLRSPSPTRARSVRASPTSTCWSSPTCSRPRRLLATARPTGVTYLIPAAAHVEVGGSATNSGRTLQWRYQARKPAGNSKADLELLFRLAYALDRRRCLQPHLGRVGAAGCVTATRRSTTSCTDRSTRTAWNPASATAFEAVTATVDSGHRDRCCDRQRRLDACGHRLRVGRGDDLPRDGLRRALPAARSGSTPVRTTAALTWLDNTIGHCYGSTRRGWTVQNRAKSRNQTNTGTYASHGWGYSWLVNRRVLYNNTTEAPGDIADFFMGPDSCSRLFVSTSTAVLNYSRWYRTIHRLADRARRTRPARSSGGRSRASGSFPGAHGALRVAAR